jgi:hypothetical protein
MNEMTVSNTHPQRQKLNTQNVLREIGRSLRFVLLEEPF